MPEMAMDETRLPLVLNDMLARAATIKDEGGWEKLHPGVDVRYLYRTSDSGPSAALVRYQPGAAIPYHEHAGYEHVLVLDGSQSDERGDYAAGTFVVNAPGSGHRVRSADGCVVLIVWERGVTFPALAPDQH